MEAWVIVTGIAALLAGYLAHLGLSFLRRMRARAAAEQVCAASRAAAEERLRRAHAEAEAQETERRARFEREVRDENEGLKELERLLGERERDLERFASLVAQKDEARARLQAQVDERERVLQEGRREVQRLKAEQRRALLERAGFTETSAREHLLHLKTQLLDREMSLRQERSRARLEEEAERFGREFVTTAILRCDVDHLREEKSWSVPLPKGRGPDLFQGDGAPFRGAFEAATGVKLEVDAERGEVRFDALDGVRKEVARRSLKRIFENGRIDPGRVADLVEHVRREVSRNLLKKGKGAVQSLGLGHFHQKMLRTIGRLHYRTSYGQNILKHSKEVASLCALLAGELGLDVKLARRCGFLHDVGKAIDAEMEGGHPEIGADLAQKCGEDPVVVNAILAHHEDQKRTTLYPLVVQAADAISGARPGARRRTLEKYLMRVEQIERIATAPPGVEGAYVIQAGREVRVSVDPAKVSDEDVVRLSQEIARNIEKEMSFPGTIRVTVIRESRVVAFAR